MCERERVSVVVIMYCDHILVGNFSGHEYFSNFPLCLWLGLSLDCAHLARKVNWRKKKFRPGPVNLYGRSKHFT